MDIMSQSGRLFTTFLSIRGRSHNPGLDVGAGDMIQAPAEPECIINRGTFS
jgi:hypothetical protein